MKETIEKILSVKVPYEYEQYFKNVLSNSGEQDDLVIEVKHLSNDWKYVNYKFWMLKQLDNDLTDVCSKENTNKLSIVKASQVVSRELKEQVLCIAWSHNSVERDICLFYYNDKIYGYSLNFSEDYKFDFLANNLTELLDAKEEKRVKQIDDVIDSQNWFLCDQECLTDGQEYKSLLKNYFEETSNDKVRLANIDVVKDSDSISVKLLINDSVQKWELDYLNGWIDDRVVNLMNSFLRRNKIEERFYILKNHKWGQELGIAFCTPSQVKELESNNLIK